jgi:ppGpp synthetase/RelA/SpoT-type nucleotidyltranferase
LERLREEATHTVEHALSRARIKVHSVTSRVKDESSFLEKVERKAYEDPAAEVTDLVGLRVVCLFLSDLSRVENILRATVVIHDSDDKIAGGTEPSSFGYMSTHYCCELGSGFTGPRYDDIRHIKFEVQSRTIVMDAWANISHQLAYKGEASVPEELRRDFHALSGLFYVADQHFELFFREATKTEAHAENLVRERRFVGLDLNLETLIAYLHQRLPERSHAGRATVSELVEELVAAGYGAIEEVDRQVTRAERAFAKYEIDFTPAILPGGLDKKPRFGDVGVVRISLTIADPNFMFVRKHPGPTERYTRYRDLLDP